VFERFEEHQLSFFILEAPNFVCGGADRLIGSRLFTALSRVRFTPLLIFQYEAQRAHRRR
jgi:hypothetical protein